MKLLLDGSLFSCPAVAALSSMISARCESWIIGWQNLWNTFGTMVIKRVGPRQLCVQHNITYHGVRRCIPQSWRLITAWQRAEGPSRVLPFTLLITLGVAGLLASIGELTLSAFVIAGFAGFPRTGELAAAKWGHFSFSHNLSKCTLALPITKCGHRRSAQETICISDPIVVKILWLLSKKQGPGDPF